MHKSYETISTISLETQVAQASSHELTLMLLEGAKQHITAAQVSIQKNDMEGKGKHLDKAIYILGGLKASLNLEQGGEIAANLDRLYDHSQDMLLQASLHKSVEILIHVNVLLTHIIEAWQTIKAEVDQE